MSALIIGGCGFIGSHVADALARTGFPVVVYDRNADHPSPRIPGATYIRGEFGNRDELERVFAAHRISRVVHLAYSTLPATSNQDPEFDVQTNVVEAIALLESCVRHSVGKVLFMSSGGAVYGVPKYGPLDESHPTDPISSYGITKLAIEKYLQLYQRLHGLPFVAVRAANPYGPRQNPLAAQGIVAVFMYKLLRGEQLTVWGDGTVVRDYLFVTDLADLCVKALLSPMTGVINAGSGIGISIAELISRLEATLGVSATARYEEGREVDAHSIVLDCTKARQDLSWVPSVTFEKGLDETCSWMRTFISSSLRSK